MYDKSIIEKLKNMPDNLETTLDTINREIGYGSKIVRESRDETGIYTVIKEYDNNNNLMKISKLSDLDENDNYNTHTIEYYRVNGILDYKEVFTLLYDEDAKVIGIEKRSVTRSE